MGSKCQVHHFILFNWALLISHKPLSCEYKNPLAIGAIRLDAYFAASKISKEVTLGGPTKTNYSSLSHQVPIALKDIYQEGGKIKCIVYNLAHTFKPQLQQNLTKFLICGLPTMDKISHFTLEPPICQLCKKEKEF